MPTFEIPDAPTIVELERGVGASGPASAAIVFNVTNKFDQSCGGRLSIVVAGDAKRDWFSIDGERERMFGPGETQTATIRIDVPAEVAAGSYPFRLRVVNVNDPDNDYAEGPTTAAKVPAAAAHPEPPPQRPAPPAPPRRPLPMTIIGWLLIAGGTASLATLVVLRGQAEGLVALLIGAIGIASGYGVLKGNNWSRLVAVGFGLVVLGLFVGAGAAQAAVYVALPAAVIAFFLFRPRANAWFKESAGSAV